MGSKYWVKSINNDRKAFYLKHRGGDLNFKKSKCVIVPIIFDYETYVDSAGKITPYLVCAKDLRGTWFIAYLNLRPYYVLKDGKINLLESWKDGDSLGTSLMEMIVEAYSNSCNINEQCKGCKIGAFCYRNNVNLNFMMYAHNAEFDFKCLLDSSRILYVTNICKSGNRICGVKWAFKSLNGKVSNYNLKDTMSWMPMTLNEAAKSSGMTAIKDVFPHGDVTEETITADYVPLNRIKSLNKRDYAEFLANADKSECLNEDKNGIYRKEIIL